MWTPNQPTPAWQTQYGFNPGVQPALEEHYTDEMTKYQQQLSAVKQAYLDALSNAIETKRSPDAQLQFQGVAPAVKPSAPFSANDGVITVPKGIGDKINAGNPGDVSIPAPGTYPEGASQKMYWGTDKLAVDPQTGIALPKEQQKGYQIDLGQKSTPTTQTIPTDPTGALPAITAMQTGKPLLMGQTSQQSNYPIALPDLYGNTDQALSNQASEKYTGDINLTQEMVQAAKRAEELKRYVPQLSQMANAALIAPGVFDKDISGMQSGIPGTADIDKSNTDLHSRYLSYLQSGETQREAFNSAIGQQEIAQLMSTKEGAKQVEDLISANNTYQYGKDGQWHVTRPDGTVVDETIGNKLTNYGWRELQKKATKNSKENRNAEGFGIDPQRPPVMPATGMGGGGGNDRKPPNIKLDFMQYKDKEGTALTSQWGISHPDNNENLSAMKDVPLIKYKTVSKNNPLEIKTYEFRGGEPVMYVNTSMDGGKKWTNNHGKDKISMKNFNEKLGTVGNDGQSLYFSEISANNVTDKNGSDATKNISGSTDDVLAFSKLLTAHQVIKADYSNGISRIPGILKNIQVNRNIESQTKGGEKKPFDPFANE
jgi:hypothetical protein